MGKTLLRKLLSIFIGVLVLTAELGCGPSSSGLNTNDDPSYFGRSANEGAFWFETYIYINKQGPEFPTEKDLYNEVKNAIRFTLGAMHNEASIYSFFKTKIIKTELVSPKQHPKQYKVTYRFDGKGVFDKYKSNFNLIVPTMPRRLFEIADYKCHDLNDKMDEGNFWYVWQPKKVGCPILEGVHYNKIYVELSIVGQTRDSYPEYDRLVIDGKLNATVFFGADYRNKDWNPISKEQKDPGAASYRRLRGYLTKNLGYKARQLTTEEMVGLYNPKDKSKIPFGEEISKSTSRGVIRYQLFYLETQYFEAESEAFHYILRNALKKESVVFYEGHSGIGRNLNLDRIENRHQFKFNFNPNYQLMFVGSCMPYAYYIDMLFKRKSTELDPNGTKNLDLFAYGKESYFASPEDHNIVLALDTYMTIGGKMSYQQIITERPNHYFGVLGDEDNPGAR